MKKQKVKQILLRFILLLFIFVLSFLLVTFILMLAYYYKQLIHHFEYDNIIYYFKKTLTKHQNFLMYFLPFSISLITLIHWIWFAPKSNSSKVTINESSNYLYNEYLVGDYKEYARELDLTNKKANWVISFKKVFNWKKFRNNKIKWTVNKKDIHSVVIGGTGSGKTQRVLFPNIFYNVNLDFKERPNFVLTDPKGELITKTGKLFVENGYEVKIIDLEDYTKSEFWNPLQIAWDTLHCKKFQELNDKDYSQAFTYLQEVVASLDWGDSSGDKFWVESAKQIANTILKYWLLLSLENENFKKYQITPFPKEMFLLSNITKMLGVNQFTNNLWKEISEKLKYTDIYWNDIATEIEEVTQITETTLSGILKNLASVILVFSQNSEVKNVTSKDTLNFKQLIANNENKPFAVFIKFPDEKVRVHFLVSVLIDQIYKLSLEYINHLPAKKLERKLMFILEEMGSLPPIPKFDSKISIARSRNIFFLMVLQDYEQLKKYGTHKGENKIIQSNAGLTYMLASENIDTLKEISTKMGDKEIRKKSENYSLGTKMGGSNSFSIETKPLMSVDELKNKEADKMIVLLAGNKPIVIKSRLAYKEFPSYFAKDREYILESKNELASKEVTNYDLQTYSSQKNSKQINLAIQEAYKFYGKAELKLPKANFEGYKNALESLEIIISKLKKEEHDVR